jgi:putative DNA methylase
MTYKKTLIEVALPLEDINREAAREKSIRHGHPSTLHLWWARRPLAACRAVLFASLVDDPSECVEELMADAAKRKAAEKAFAAQKKVWDTRKALYDKAASHGMPASSNPPPGPEPKLEDILVEMERERLFDIIRELVKWENSNDERVLNKARAEILRSTGGNPPPVYDPFCGGGSIPLEAQRLGLEAHASDLNPVPVLINKALIEIPPKFAGKPPVNPESRKKLSASGTWKGAAGLAEDIRYYGQWMRDEAEKRIGHLYPKVKLPKEHGGGEATVIAWLWARTVASPNPAAKGAHVPLVRSFWLSSKAGKKSWVEPVVDPSTMTYRFDIRIGDGQARTGTVSRTGAVCLLTGSPIPLEYVRTEGKAGRLAVRLMAVVAEMPVGRVFLPPDDEQDLIARSAEPNVVPDTDLPEQALGFRVQNYGMTKHRHLFTTRQLTSLSSFVRLVGEARTKAHADAQATQQDHGSVGLESGGTGASAYADAIATYLAFGVSRLADRGSNLASWDPNPSGYAPKIRNTFARQTLAMTWDFAEGNPFNDSTGNWTDAIGWITKVLARAITEIPGHAKQGDATNIEGYPSNSVISTDPPYYDNIGYADLSDFFYAWLRLSLHSVYPGLMGTVQVPKAQELIATPFRFEGSKEKARTFFESGLREAFQRMRDKQSPHFPLTVYYAFKQAESDEDVEGSDSSQASTGWETMLEGLLQSGFAIDGTWPIRSELSNRMIASGTNALASSIVLVCRPRAKDAGVASRRDFLAALKRELPEALRNLQKGNIAPVDLAQAAIGPGMAVFSRYARVLETDGSPMGVRTALSLINQSLDEVLAEQEGEFDADTRWALAWFDQYGFTEGAYGTAETLSTAKNTSVSGMVEAGILAAKGGKVRLLKKEELPADWNPASDDRLTVWEATHHLIRSLDGGEQAAAGLLKKLGAVAEVARDLSYRLYTVCERRKWAQDAIGYNALVLSWPDLKRLADEQKAAGPKQGELI